MATFHVTPFAAACLDHAAAVWGASIHHPFVRALADGTLEPQIFKFYQMQDARYLEAFSDTAALISTRCVRPEDKLWFIDSSRIALVTEASLHAGYGEKLGYNAADIAAMEVTPNNAAYQNHMISTALRGTLVEAVAALAPCPWLYIDLGQRLLGELGTIPDSHPYADWLRMYSDPQFNEYMTQLLERLDRFANEADAAAQRRALDAFEKSARYEWMFWQQAWERQTWLP